MKKEFLKHWLVITFLILLVLSFIVWFFIYKPSFDFLNQSIILLSSSGKNTNDYRTLLNNQIWNYIICSIASACVVMTIIFFIKELRNSKIKVVKNGLSEQKNT